MSQEPETINLDLVVGGTAPTITSNFDSLKLAIAARLETYRIEVTEENLAQAKKDATELGKAATQLNKLKSEKAAEFSAPIDAFKAQVMELVGMIQEGQEFIKKQVKVFEDKTRALCLEKMTSCLRGAYMTFGVREEYQTGTAQLAGMVGISKVTAKGDLTKAAKDAVTALATNDRALQDRTDGRLATLTAKCYESGLKSPLTRAHVENIILADDAAYSAGLAKMIGIEIERQAATLKAEQDRMEREAKQKAEREAKEAAAKEREKERAEEAARRAKEEAEKATVAAPPAPAPVIHPPESPLPLYKPAEPPAPAPSFSFPVAPQKQKLAVVVTFTIETTKTAPADLSAIDQWFTDQIRNIPNIPPFKITIGKGA